jgi:hypothetical protein
VIRHHDPGGIPAFGLAAAPLWRLALRQKRTLNKSGGQANQGSFRDVVLLGRQ